MDLNELSPSLIDSIKAAFKDSKTVDIAVSESIDETEYLLSSKANRAHLIESFKEFEEGKGITLTLEELKEKYGK